MFPRKAGIAIRHELQFSLNVAQDDPHVGRCATGDPPLDEMTGVQSKD